MAMVHAGGALGQISCMRPIRGRKGLHKTKPNESIKKVTHKHSSLVLILALPPPSRSRTAASRRAAAHFNSDDDQPLDPV